jgi:glycine cleavage system transcriptional repressor
LLKPRPAFFPIDADERHGSLAPVQSPRFVMTVSARVSVSCADHVGLVAAISGRLFDLGGNLGDTTFAVVGGSAEFFAIVEFPDTTSLADVGSELRAVPDLADAVVSVTPTISPPEASPASAVTHTITVFGGDRPGLVARLSEALADFRANIVRLEAERMPTSSGLAYAVRIAAHVPPDTAASCLATVTNTAGSLGLSCQIEQSIP